MNERRLGAVHVGLLVVALGAAVFVRAGAEGAADWSLSISPVTSPAKENGAQPQITIQGEQAVLSWLERSGARATLKFSERTRSGWSEPQTVVSGEDFFVNWADVPSVLRLADGALAAHWLQKSASSTYAYDVRLAWSRDNGRTWTPSVTPHHDGTRTEHGFASLFQAPGAGLGLVWLDGRAMSPESHGGHDGKDAGAMGVRAAVFDRDGSQRSEMVVDTRVCECCPTAAAVTSEGVIAAFRNRTDDEVRDIYVARLVDGKWSEPVPVHRDNWKIAACPVNGPALSAIGRDVAIAWFTAQGEQGHAFVAFSSDAGRSFGPPVRVDDEGSLGRVDGELLPDGSAVVCWVEFADQRAQFRVRRVDRSGARSPSATVSGIGAGRASGYPRMARRGNELLLAWTETSDGASRVLTAAAALPTSPTGRD
jgi:hypothetical protein